MKNRANLATISPDLEGTGSKGKEGFHLKKELGLLDGVAIIFGVIVGAGIFVSPKGVLLEAGSPGLALIIWIACGLLSLVGALCYAELGTMIPKSGGDYQYILESLGQLPGFLFLWVAILIIVPTGNAVLALTFSTYTLQPFWPECAPPDLAVRLLSGLVISLLTAINCYNVKWTARIQDIFAVMKFIALIVIIVAGLVVMATSGMGNFSEPFEGTNTDPGSIALAFYSGLFSFAGWNYLNFVTEELKDPFKSLPRAIWISLPLVTVVYALANLSYFVVLSKMEILNSNAVAVTFGDELLGYMAWIMPAFVACSTFGALNGNIFAPSRLVFTGAREGHLPKALALINIHTWTPIPALLFLGLVSLMMLLVKDVYTLINYIAFSEALAWAACVFGLILLRWTQPDAVRPIKINLVFPILFFVICVFLIITPMFLNSAYELLVAVSIVLSGIPVYFIFIYWERKPSFIRKLAAIDSSRNYCFGCFKYPDDDPECEPLLGQQNRTETPTKLDVDSPLPVTVIQPRSIPDSELLRRQDSMDTHILTELAPPSNVPAVTVLSTEEPKIKNPKIIVSPAIVTEPKVGDSEVLQRQEGLESELQTKLGADGNVPAVASGSVAELSCTPRQS